MKKFFVLIAFIGFFLQGQAHDFSDYRESNMSCVFTPSDTVLKHTWDIIHDSVGTWVNKNGFVVRATGIDGKTTGNTTLTNVYGFVASKHYVVERVHIWATSVSGVIVSLSTITIGNNSSSFNDIVVAALLTGITTADNLASNTFSVLNSSVHTGDIVFKVTIGASLTTLTLTVVVTGRNLD